MSKTHTQTCLPLRFWRKAHDFLGYLMPLRLLSISLQFGKFEGFPESFRFRSVISLRFRILQIVSAFPVIKKTMSKRTLDDDSGFPATKKKATQRLYHMPFAICVVSVLKIAFCDKKKEPYLLFFFKQLTIFNKKG